MREADFGEKNRRITTDSQAGLLVILDIPKEGGSLFIYLS